MSVEIRFDGDEATGLVAEGSRLWDVARRMGVPLLTECKGRGECQSCAVFIAHGSELLSKPTECERKQLGDRLLADERLACQMLLDHTGTVSVRRIVKDVQAGKQTGTNFRSLTFNQKIGALLELEASMMAEALNRITDTRNSLISRFLKLNKEEQKRKTTPATESKV